MLIEMVAVTLAVFSSFAPLPGVFSVPDSSTQSSILSQGFTISNVEYREQGLLLQENALLQEGLTLEPMIAPDVTSPIPTEALQSSISEESIVAMLTIPTPTILPTATPTPPPPTETPTPEALPTPTEIPTPTPPPSVAAPIDMESLFTRFSDEYKVDKELLKRIAKCESSFNTEAINGDYLGMFQFATSSWSAIRGRMGADSNPDLRKNAEETIRTAAYHIANGGQNAWPSCK